MKKGLLDNSLQTEELSSETAIALGWSTNGIPEVVVCRTQSSPEKHRVEKDSLDKFNLIKEIEKNLN